MHGRGLREERRAGVRGRGAGRAGEREGAPMRAYSSLQPEDREKFTSYTAA
jgi:hypothetical protein